MTPKKSALDILFGSPLRVKLLRFFLLNQEAVFPLAVLKTRTNTKPIPLKKDINTLLKAGFIKKGITTADENIGSEFFKKGKGKKSKKTRTRKQGFILDPKFPYVRELRQLFTSVIPEARVQIGKNAKKIGNPKVVIVSGIFLDRPSNPVDLLLVGDQIKKKQLELMLKRLERELGKEIVYTVFPTEEFELRYGMRDKFIQTLLRGPHEILLDEFQIIEKGT
ncbi:MAG: hypothetical protein A3C80_01375 [Candidatus Ryanbacteria bacterium RIFCSPHIGHO2_02_FULL_45_43]|uniref:Polymerase nucleotidyl transferase domain-containing protein n=1 Tax=Candidatus Ryanbacteria bacterium RIFCSPHIGHO2_01_45_13 TaxID=1802112 RepID=A0A1G2FXG6_9BACT|nr:MAG: hypothetical protein A2W41_00960 [Candidatus Ryanbacteria bacterium RIFCSPHIGHO2_01_45_13]OGZ42373.1 MAG: hypothetical protein A2718_02310 [Candidatus Ryanbacteria bacterium RIFCSPHIGHO2_01_FULL_44_130]OGZ48329.1 MAG: hypothetical protein A3C80_01375 [Candidatus Ryanbacteria bacterium RIFCSPHIGHO2_02_FULL_45_43]OGZ50439.1 MAG: hypothetical protein A3E55_03555 [Candidatus Ryanbacteria bacterium RIFCSPHIGHO2_12_FULL_44_20]OGZ52110.1 MAG: hypothetical protein A3A17_01520 [Candidatus Ryanba